MMSNYLMEKQFASFKTSNAASSGWLKNIPISSLPPYCQQLSKPTLTGMTNGQRLNNKLGSTVQVVNSHQSCHNHEHNNNNKSHNAQQHRHHDDFAVEAEEALETIAETIPNCKTPKGSSLNISSKNRGWFHSLFKTSSSNTNTNSTSPITSTSLSIDTNSFQSNLELAQNQSFRKLFLVSKNNFESPVNQFKPKNNVELLHRIPWEMTTSLKGNQLRLESVFNSLLIETDSSFSGQLNSQCSSPKTSLNQSHSLFSPPFPLGINNNGLEWTIWNRTGALLFNKEGRCYYSSIANTELEKILFRLLTENVLETNSSGSSSSSTNSSINKSNSTHIAAPLTKACLKETVADFLQDTTSISVKMSAFDNCFREMIFGSIELNRSKRTSEITKNTNIISNTVVGRQPFTFKLHFIGSITLQDEHKKSVEQRNDLYISSFVVHLKKGLLLFVFFLFF